MRTLVIAAHPDDEVLGCGGTIARLTDEGHQVSIAILGEGITSRYAQRDQAKDSELRQLRECSAKVAELLGAECFTYDLPDNRFDTVPLLDIIKIIEDLVDRLAPEAVYTHHGGDLNIDHAIVHRATMTAVRPLPDGPVPAVYAYEVPSSTEWSLQRFSPVFRPSVFIDIDRTLERKLRAMRLYEGEVRPAPHPRSPEVLRAIALRWGSVCGRSAAEPFELIREVR